VGLSRKRTDREEALSWSLPMFVVEVITDTGYWTGSHEYDDLELAYAELRGLRSQLAGTDGFVAVRVIDLTHVTRW
jgi:hypothetical protein